MIWLPGVLSQGGEKFTWAKCEIAYAAVKGASKSFSINYSNSKKAASAYTIQGDAFVLTNPTTKTAVNISAGDYLVNVTTSSNSSTSGQNLYEVTSNSGRGWDLSTSKISTSLTSGSTVHGYTDYTVNSSGAISLSGVQASWAIGSGSNFTAYSNVSTFTSSGLSVGPHSKVYWLSHSGSGTFSVYECTATQGSKVEIEYTSYSLAPRCGTQIDEVVSSNPTAYPDNGIQGDYWYVRYSDTPITWERYAMSEGEIQGESVTQTATSSTYFYRATSYSRSGKTFTATGTRTRASSLAVGNYLIQSNGAFVNSTSMSGDTLFKITKKSGSYTVSLTFDTYTVGDVKGSYVDSVTSYNPYEFPDDGAQDGYWYVKV